MASTTEVDMQTPVQAETGTSLPAGLARSRPYVAGKFIYAGGEKLFIRGVTYGPFRPDSAGNVYHKPDQVEQDFAKMAANNINAIRTYHVPPLWMMDAAQRHGLRVMVGLPWESHIAFFEEKGLDRDIEQRVRREARKCADHPALFCYSIANEVPGSIARWYGRARIEQFLHHLYGVIKSEAPDTLVTYVNYPTTEYLQLPFVDFVCFNVYLEFQERLEAYMGRLQNIAADKPLIMGELGLDSLRNGEEAQAESLEWQIRTIFGGGCAGAFVFAWTDEWFNAGRDVDDWEFGITRRDRQPKLALERVRRAYAETPFPPDQQWPSVSVVVCTNNGAGTIEQCCAGLKKLDYPHYEVIVVDDGSNDRTLELIQGHGFRVISTENRGLGSARNTGAAAAKGEIIAYIDDDAVPDKDWLRYLVATFASDGYAGVGGPNIAPPDSALVARCVDHSPGNPTHVLLTDKVAEHIPGCNMAFRKHDLQAVGGFDTRFWIAGDDVDICWQMQKHGRKLGFSPSAMVWHHRRGSVRAYLKQQLKYGEAESLLEGKWPAKYNGFGHVGWTGKLYANGAESTSIFNRWRVYHGVWGSRYFQSIYEPDTGSLLSLMLAPEWYLVVFGLALLVALGLFWSPLLLFVPVLLLAMTPQLLYALIRGFRIASGEDLSGTWQVLEMSLLVSFFQVTQPLVRLIGRLRGGLTPWRRRGGSQLAFPRRRSMTMWREEHQMPEGRLEAVESFLATEGIAFRRGGVFDRWDLEIRGGTFGAVRLLQATEEHGQGRQMIRLRTWPRYSPVAIVVIVLLGFMAAVAGVQQAWAASAALGVFALLLAMRTISDGAVATAICLKLFDFVRREGS